jgi:hypothetical protein
MAKASARIGQKAVQRLPDPVHRCLQTVSCCWTFGLGSNVCIYDVRKAQRPATAPSRLDTDQLLSGGGAAVPFGWLSDEPLRSQIRPHMEEDLIVKAVWIKTA